MRTALLTLIGFLAVTLCPSTCPMSMEVASEAHAGHDMMAMDHSTVDHSTMHHGNMDHEEDSPCEHCEENSNHDVSLSSTESIIDVPGFSIALLTTIENLLFVEHSQKTLQTHLAAAGPPLASSIVRTIVLRT